MKILKNIHFRLALKTDRRAILEFFREHYFPYETLTRSIEPRKHDAHAEEDILKCVEIADRFCLLALCGNQIAGVVAMCPKGPGEEQKHLKEASKIPASPYATVLKILAKAESESNVFKKYNNFNVAMQWNEMAVNKDFRGNKIGLRMADSAMQIGKALGYSLFTSECTSKHSARICECLGMECINVINLEEYRLPGSDEQIIFPPEDEKYLKSYAKVFT